MLGGHLFIQPSKFVLGCQQQMRIAPQMTFRRVLLGSQLEYCACLACLFPGLAFP